jgi:hypothetical protein
MTQTKKIFNSASKPLGQTKAKDLEISRVNQSDQKTSKEKESLVTRAVTEDIKSSIDRLSQNDFLLNP